MRIYKISVSLFFFLFSASLCAQISFDNPLHQSPLFLAGSFAELRSNHFHSGIDIKTDGVIGKPVYAIEDGYISRIAVSPWGFGRAIYITHPNGYTSLYAHLSRFSDAVDAYVRAEQRRLKKNEINLYPSKNKFPVTRGQQIAWSGNSGSSGGPHLHFEIRKSASEHPINPLQFKFPITDNLPPQILSLEIIDNESHRAFFTPRLIEKKTRQANYKINNLISVSSPVRFAIESYDYLNGSSNQCGLNKLTLWVDDQPVFGFVLNEVAYSDMRYINSLIDYPVYMRFHKRYQRLFRQPGNLAHIYSINKNDGVVVLSDTLPHHIKIVATDSYKNTSTLQFTIQNKSLKTTSKSTKKKYSYNEEHTIWGPHFSLHIPKNTLYDDAVIDRDEISTTKKQYVSPIYKIGSDTIPLHKKADLKFQFSFPHPQLQSNLCLVRIDHYGNPKKEKIIYTSGRYDNGYFFAKTKTLGYFAFMLDTVPPVIRPVYLTPRADIYKRAEIKFKVTDDLSGIARYDLYIDNQWQPVFYNAKKSQMICTFDASVKRGRHSIRFVVSDSKGNKQVYISKFLY